MIGVIGRSHSLALTYRRVLVALFVLIPIGLGACTSSGTRAVLVPKVIDCVGKPVEKPSSLTLTCADANTLLDKIRWSEWKPSIARGSAILIENTCTPTCVAGTFVRYPATVTLSDVYHRGSTRLFTDATVRYRKMGSKLTIYTYPLVTRPL
jgi:hypothetical protein